MLVDGTQRSFCGCSSNWSCPHTCCTLSFATHSTPLKSAQSPVESSTRSTRPYAATRYACPRPRAASVARRAKLLQMGCCCLTFCFASDSMLCLSHPAHPPLRRTPIERSPRDLHESMPRVATRPRARWRASSVDRATMCADTCCLALQCPRRHGRVPALPGPCPRTAHACALRAHARTAVPRIAS